MCALRLRHPRAFAGMGIKQPATVRGDRKFSHLMFPPYTLSHSEARKKADYYQSLEKHFSCRNQVKYAKKSANQYNALDILRINLPKDEKVQDWHNRLTRSLYGLNRPY